MLPSEALCALEIAEVGVELRSDLGDTFRLELPPSFRDFESRRRDADFHLRFDSRGSLEPSSSSLITSGSHWKLLQSPRGHCFEFFHPHWNKVLITATAIEDSLDYDILFSEAACRRLWGSSKEERSPLYIMHPLDQLVFLRTLAHRDSFLVHACGAVIDAKAFVFAGHSDAGKTTLSRMLAAEGVELLSDERIAIRKVGATFMAYGTPWTGEGNIFSPAGYPLGGVFLLHQGTYHRISEGRRVKMTAEFLSRCIVPYYFPHETADILALVSDVARKVPLRHLEFSRKPGLLPILTRAA